MADATAIRFDAAFGMRPGHVVVTGPTADAAAMMVARLETQIPASRLVWVSGRGLDAGALRHVLAGDSRPAGPLHATVRKVLAHARSERRPLVVVVRDADALDAARLEWLRVTLECAPDAAELVRLVLVGGPTLLTTLRRPEARALATRVTSRFTADADAAPVRVRPAVPRRRVAAAAAAGALVSIGIWALALAPWREPPASPAPRQAAVPHPPAPASLPAAPEIHVTRAPTPAPPPAAAVEAPAPPPVIEAPVSPPTDGRPASTPPRRTPRATGGTAARLQVGAFRDPANADALRARLAKRFAHVTVSTVSDDGVTYHRVRIEGLQDDAAVRAALATLRRAGHQAIRVGN